MRYSHLYLVGTIILSIFSFCLWGWTKSDVYKRKVDAQDKLLTRILDATASTKKCENQLR